MKKIIGNDLKVRYEWGEVLEDEKFLRVEEKYMEVLEFNWFLLWDIVNLGGWKVKK